MTRTGAFALAVSLAWAGAVVDVLPDLHPPAWAERWLYNPRERTEAARRAQEAGRETATVERLDTALRLRPDDPATLYNAGTGRLFAGTDGERAAKLLERAAEGAGPELAPHAFYNLGNARLAGGDPAAAIAAYEEALRRSPELRPAKRNLEVALARLEEDRAAQSRSQPPQETPDGDRAGEEEPSREAGGTDRAPEPEPEPDPGQAGADGDAPRPDPGTRGATGTPRLPRFEVQEDMTAAQAAALLEAIESLEREQRRLEAAERAAADGATTEKDW